MAMAISGLNFRAVAAHSSSNTGTSSCNSRSTTRVCCCSGEDDSRFLRREAAARVVFAAVVCNSPLLTWAGAAAGEEQPKMVVLDSGLGFRDTRVGVGKPVVNGSFVKVHYTGKLEDGTQFETSYTFNNRPLEFRLGFGEVIDGWDRGILGGDGIPPMVPGGRRVLRVPASMAFGEEGVGCKKGKPLLTLLKSIFNPGKSSSKSPEQSSAPRCFIPPNATLFFDVELLEAFELPKNSKGVKKRR